MNYEQARLTKNGWLICSRISFSVLVCSIYSFSISTSFYNDLIANNSLVVFNSASITFPKALYLNKKI